MLVSHQIGIIMTIQEINQYYSEVRECLDGSRLAAAMAGLSAVVDGAGDYSLREELDSIRQTYGMMLHYFVQAMPDSRRHEMARDLRRRLYMLNDRANFHALSGVSASDYFSKVRSQQLASVTVRQLAMELRRSAERLRVAAEDGIYRRELHDDVQGVILRLFNKVWIVQFLDKADSEALAELLAESGDAVVTAAQCDVVGALYMGCMAYYDAAKLKLMLTAILNNGSAAVRTRAYTLLVILLAYWRDMVNCDRTLLSLLAIAAEGNDFQDALKCVVVNMIHSVDTQKINKAIAEDIIPGLMKLRPDLERNFRKMESELDGDSSEFNPGWEDIVKKSGIEDKLRRLSDMQMQGGDMFMMAFARMKSMPFFREEANWFIPFDTDRSEVHDSVERMPEGFADLIHFNRIFCHTDCYSMFLGLNAMPESSKNMMSSQLKAQLGQLKEERDTSFRLSAEPQLITEIGLFVKDLYRFHHQFVNRQEFHNPFAFRFDYVSLPVFGRCLSDVETLTELGNLYFSRGMWESAVSVFNALQRHYSDYISAVGQSGPRYVGDGDVVDAKIADIFEKKGYALMKLKDYASAAETLTVAMRFEEPGAWLLSRLAECFKRMGNVGKARQYLDKALQAEPDNRRLLLKRSRMYMEEGEYPEAVGMFYKLNYLDPDNLLYVRLLAWCRCLQGKPEKALEMYGRIAEGDRDAADILNVGHCHFAMGGYQDAVKCYRAYIARKDVATFMKAVENDLESLPFLRESRESFGWVRDAAILG